MDRPELRTGALFGGTFRISHPLGAGGMAVVYAVEQIATGQPRALKLMHPQMLTDTSLRAKFEQEARVSALIPSEHVVQVIDAGVDEDTDIPWIAMELLDGEDVDAYVRRRGPLSAPEALEILRQACHALGAAHRVGIVHRDLKPQNLFVAVPTSLGAPPVVKVLDFGIAKVVADARRSTSTLGTPLWMSPEHSDPKATVTPAADVWSIGLLAFWLLTGQELWRCAEDPDVAMQAVLKELLLDPIPAASERARELGAAGALPPRFDAWFARCLTREASERYADATEAYEALCAALGDVQPAPSVEPPEHAEVHQKVRKAFENSAPVAVVRASGKTAAETHTASGGLQRVALIALSTALIMSGVLAYALGLVQLGPVTETAVKDSDGDSRAAVAPVESFAPSEPAPAPEPRASLEVQPPPEPVDPPEPVEPPEAVPTPVASARARKAAPALGEAPKAKGPFDTAAAHAALNRQKMTAQARCAGKEGPRSINVRVFFHPSGVVQRILSNDPREAGKPSAVCMRQPLHLARVPAFDGPEQSVTATVAIR